MFSRTFYLQTDFLHSRCLQLTVLCFFSNWFLYWLKQQHFSGYPRLNLCVNPPVTSLHKLHSPLFVCRKREYFRFGQGREGKHRLKTYLKEGVKQGRNRQMELRELLNGNLLRAGVVKANLFSQSSCQGCQIFDLITLIGENW